MLKFKFNKARPEQGLGFLFWQTTHAWQRQLTDALKPLDLTHTQFLLLAGLDQLSHKHDSVKQTMLASHAGIDVMMTSNVTRTLIKKQLISKEAHPSDTRAHQLCMTDKGSKRLHQAIEVADKVEQAFFERLGEQHSTIHQTVLKLLV
jgi:DNA-binding MarR family transcriptional regulator